MCGTPVENHCIREQGMDPITATVVDLSKGQGKWKWKKSVISLRMQDIENKDVLRWSNIELIENQAIRTWEANVLGNTFWLVLGSEKKYRLDIGDLSFKPLRVH